MDVYQKIEEIIEKYKGDRTSALAELDELLESEDLSSEQKIMVKTVADQGRGVFYRRLDNFSIRN